MLQSPQKYLFSIVIEISVTALGMYVHIWVSLYENNDTTFIFYSFKKYETAVLFEP